VSRSEISLASVDLSALAASVMDAHTQRQPGRAVQFTAPPGITARCDSRFARIVLENLIGNAWKYSQPAPVVRIEFGVQPIDVGPAEPAVHVLFVRDNGVGFDMKHVEKLFKPFHRLHGVNEFDGNGIGLATVHRILERHGGAIWCEAAEGQGATFYFRFDGPRPDASA
jgi:signal transduction histidine kinase